MTTRSKLPELDLARIRRYVDSRVPAHVRDEVRIEAEVHGTVVTIVECRPPWRADIGPKWTRSPVARLKYSPTDAAWTLFWRDRDLRWHRYEEDRYGRPCRAAVGRDRSGPDGHLLGLRVDRQPTPHAYDRVAVALRSSGHTSRYSIGGISVDQADFDAEIVAFEVVGASSDGRRPLGMITVGPLDAIIPRAPDPGQRSARFGHLRQELAD